MPDKQLDTSILLSIQQYERVRDLLKKMEQGVGTADPEELGEFNSSLLELQSQATHTDTTISTLLQDEKIDTVPLESLIAQRELVLKEILHLNEIVNTKAKGVKSLLAHEIGTIRNGLSAMNGYRQQQHNQGRIVNSSS